MNGCPRVNPQGDFTYIGISGASVIDYYFNKLSSVGQLYESL